MDGTLKPGGFGGREGLELRLNTWANSLSRDKRYPWVGSGLLDDLKAAAKVLGAPPFEEMFPPSGPRPLYPEPETKVEYDL